MICRSNQWTGLYVIGTSVMKELKTVLEKAAMLIRCSGFASSNFQQSLLIAVMPCLFRVSFIQKLEQI